MVMYLTLIALCMVAVVLINWLAIGWSLLHAMMWTAITTGTELAIIIALAVLTGFCVPKVLYRECKLYSVGKREMNFYRAIRLNRWKDYIIELGGISGFSKKKLVAPNDPAYIDRFIAEINKGMFIHIVGTLGSFLILLVPFPGFWSITFPVAVISAILNYLPMMVLRYNKPRLLMLKARLVRNQPKAPADNAETPTETPDATH